MENIDAAKAARVWQRVQGGHSRDPEDLIPLATYEQGDAATYLQLSRRFQGRDAAILRLFKGHVPDAYRQSSAYCHSAAYFGG